MKIADVLKAHPACKKVFEKYIPACVTCGGASAESIERGARMHRLDLNAFLKDLNRAAQPRKKK